VSGSPEQRTFAQCRVYLDARDRIVCGPWQNFKGEIVTQSVDDLHSDNNKLNMQTLLMERGAMIPGVGCAPNGHQPYDQSELHQLAGRKTA
jgi:hypothetical protein